LEKETRWVKIRLLKETLAITTKVIQTLVKFNSWEDVDLKIKLGMNIKKKLEKTQKELEEWKKIYAICVPTSNQD